MLSLTMILPVEDRRVEIRQKGVSIFNRNIAVADNHIPVCNLDIAPEMDGFCGQVTEYRAFRPQVSGWRRQIPRPRMQFRVAGCGKLRSINEILRSINGISWSARAMLRSGIGRSKLATGLRRSEFQKQVCTMEITPKNGDLYVSGQVAFALGSSFFCVGLRLRFRHFCVVWDRTLSITVDTDYLIKSCNFAK
jgi:hypothetical protein